MFTRIVEMTIRPESRNIVIEIHNEQVLPELRKQTGFVDAVGLTSTDNPNHLISVTFWRTRQDAETYQQNTFSRLINLVSAYITHPPTIRTYDVVTSTVHKIAAGRAA